MLKGFSDLSGFSDLQDGASTQSREIGVEEKEPKSGKSHEKHNTANSTRNAGKTNDEIRDLDRSKLSRKHAEIVLALGSATPGKCESLSNQQQGWQTKKTNHVEGENDMATLKDKAADYPSPSAQADTVYKADEYWLDGDEAWDRNGILPSTSDYGYDTWFDNRWGVDDVDMNKLDELDHQDNRGHPGKELDLGSITIDETKYGENQEVSWRLGHLDASTDEIHIHDPPAHTTPIDLDSDEQPTSTTEDGQKTFWISRHEVGEMVDDSGNRSTDSQFGYSGLTLTEQFQKAHKISTSKKIFKVYPHMRDTKLYDEQPWEYFMNGKKKKQSRSKVTTVAFHMDGMNYVAKSVNGSCKQNVWRIEPATDNEDGEDNPRPLQRRRTDTTEDVSYSQPGGKNDIKLGYAAQTKFTPYAHPVKALTPTSEWEPADFEITEDKVRTTREAKQAASGPTPGLESRTLGVTTINILGHEYTDVLHASTSSKNDLIDNFIKGLPTPIQTDENLSILRTYAAAHDHYGNKACHEVTRLEGEIEATLRENDDEQEDGSRKRKSTPAQTSLGSNPTTSKKLCRTRRVDIVARDKPSAPTHEEITTGQPTTEDKPPSMSDMQSGAEGVHPSIPVASREGELEIKHGFQILESTAPRATAASGQRTTEDLLKPRAATAAGLRTTEDLITRRLQRQPTNYRQDLRDGEAINGAQA